MIKLYGEIMGRTDVAEVLEVHGKRNFVKYRSFLGGMGVKTSVVADLDHAVTIGTPEIEALFEVDLRKIGENVLENKKSKDRTALTKCLKEAIVTKNLGELRSLWQHIEQRHQKLKENLSDEEKNTLEGFLDEQNKRNTFILSRGELEDYLPAGCNLDGTIDLVKEENLRAWLARTIGQPERGELDGIVFAILGASVEERDSVRKNLQNSA